MTFWIELGLCLDHRGGGGHCDLIASASELKKENWSDMITRGLPAPAPSPLVILKTEKEMLVSSRHQEHKYDRPFLQDEANLSAQSTVPRGEPLTPQLGTIALPYHEHAGPG